jgi:hypothetical protein
MGALGLGLVLATPVFSQWLVTPSEAQASEQAIQPPEARSVPEQGAPRVSLLTPDISSTVRRPTRIQVRFEATAPALIKPETFRVLYGSLRLDITQRVTSASQVTAQGIDVAEASLPPGSHRLLIEIQDTQGRIGRRTVGFVVE